MTPLSAYQQKTKASDISFGLIIGFLVLLAMAGSVATFWLLEHHHVPAYTVELPEEFAIVDASDRSQIVSTDTTAFGIRVSLGFAR